MMLNMMRIVGGVAAGMIAISLIVEPIEFVLVTLANGGGITMDPKHYFAIRNRDAFLAAKLVYNAIGGAAGGWIAAFISPAAPLRTGLVLAGLQAVTFVWAMNDTALAPTAPAWAWPAFAITTCGGIVLGAWVRARTARS